MPLTLPTDITSYIMPALLALSILYFFYARGKLSDAGSYEEEAVAKDLHFKALATMFMVVSLWIIVKVLSTFVAL